MKLFHWIQNNKIKFLKIIITLVFIIIILRIIHLKSSYKSSMTKNLSHNLFTYIHDCNGEYLTDIINQPYLVINIPGYKNCSLDFRQNIYNYFKNYNQNLKKIHFEQWDQRLMDSRQKYIDVKLHIKKNQWNIMEKKIIKLNETNKCLSFTKRNDRFIPYESLGYIIGTKPELGYNIPSITKFLFNHKESINKVYLTIDIRVQEVIYKVLQECMKTYQPKSAWCCVLDLETREIIAWVSLPNFNPNNEKIFIDFNNTDHILNYRYEMGSICKILSYIFLISKYSPKKYNINSLIAIPQEFKIGKFTIKDAVQFKPIEPLYNCFVRSSNKAFAVNIHSFEDSYYLNYLKLLGLEDDISVDNIFYEKSHKISLKHHQLVTLSYGYGFNFTPLRFLYMVANTVTGLKKPIHLIKNIKNKTNISIYQRSIQTQLIIDNNTLQQFYETLQLLGKSYEPLFKFNGAAKTGTSKAFLHGKYLNNQINATLMTFYPSEKPRYILFLGIENPSLGPRKYSAYYTKEPMVKILSKTKDYFDEQ